MNWSGIINFFIMIMSEPHMERSTRHDMSANMNKAAIPADYISRPLWPNSRHEQPAWQAHLIYGAFEPGSLNAQFKNGTITIPKRNIYGLGTYSLSPSSPPQETAKQRQQDGQHDNQPDADKSDLYLAQGNGVVFRRARRDGDEFILVA